MKAGLPDVGAEWSFADRMAREAGDIGDRLHPEPEFDQYGKPKSPCATCTECGSDWCKEWCRP